MRPENRKSAVPTDVLLSENKHPRFKAIQVRDAEPRGEERFSQDERLNNRT
jgi:hypothetical protein